MLDMAIPTAIEEFNLQEWCMNEAHDSVIDAISYFDGVLIMHISYEEEEENQVGYFLSFHGVDPIPEKRLYEDLVLHAIDFHPPAINNARLYAKQIHDINFGEVVRVFSNQAPDYVIGNCKTSVRMVFEKVPEGFPIAYEQFEFSQLTIKKVKPLKY